MSNGQQGNPDEVSRREFLAAGVGAGAGALLAGILPADGAAAEPAGPSGLERAHAHNDYEHDRPLLDALARGFKSVEADVWLVEGELLVAHERALVRRERTLESLYLGPLRRAVAENGGSVYPGDPDHFTLLVDIKSEAEPTYRVLDEQLGRHEAMLTTFGSGGVRGGAVTAVVSGNRPRELMRKQRVRRAFHDGRLSDLGVDTDPSFTPLISDNWTKNFVWQGVGPMPEAERGKLRAIVTEAHGSGQRVRFWATPELPEAREAVWGELVSARADHVNTDHLQELEVFLLRNDPNPTEPYVSWAGRAGGGRG